MFEIEITFPDGHVETLISNSHTQADDVKTVLEAEGLSVIVFDA
jgi:hypothetical protein